MRPTDLQGARDVAQRCVHDALMPKELFAFLVEMQQQQQQQQQTNEATNKQTNKNEDNECPVAIISHMYGAHLKTGTTRAEITGLFIWCPK